MPSTSPYSGNDYQAASNFRPYELPVNDIFKGISAQNQFWDAGASRVKSVYDNALNLNLTSEANKEVRKKFMQDADKQLTKLSTMDLSDPSVQRQGFNLFKPLLRDPAIMQDDYLSSKYSSIFSEAERYKRDEKSKGLGYHMDNLAYALRPFKGFGKNTSREEMATIYERAKNAQYVPYYDVSKERKDILDDCKPNKFSNTTSQGMYLEEERITSLTSQKIWGCLEGGLSDQARQQIRISGVVRYGDDYATLKNDYIAAAQEKSKEYNDEIISLSAQRAAITGKAGHEQEVKKLDQDIKDYKEGKANYDDDLKRYNIWDDKYIKDRYEELATTAYMRRSNWAFASSFARMDIEKDKKADPVSMMYYTQQKLDQRQQAGFAHDEEMEDYKLMQKMLTGEGGADLPSTIKYFQQKGYPISQLETWLGTAEKEEGLVITDVKNTIDKSNADINTKIQDIVSSNEVQSNPHLATVFSGVTDEATFTKKLPNIYNYLNSALEKDKNDVTALGVKEGVNAYLQLVNKRIRYKSILDDAWSTAEKQNRTLFDRTFLQDKKDAVVAGYGTISPIDIADALDGKSSKYEFVRYNEVQRYDVEGKLRTTNLKLTKLVDKRTGQTLIDQGGNTRDNNWNWISSIMKKSSDNSSARVAAVNNILGKDAAVQKMMLSSGNLLGKGEVNDDPAKFTPTMKNVIDIFGSAISGKGAVKFNTRGGFDPIEGWVDIEAKDASGKSISAGDLEDAVADSPMGKSILKKGRYPNSVRVKLPHLSGVMEKPQYDDDLKTLMVYGANRVVDENLSQGLILDAGITPQGKRIQINTTKSLATGQAKYTILVDGQPIPVKIGNDEASAQDYVTKLTSGQAGTKIPK